MRHIKLSALHYAWLLVLAGGIVLASEAPLAVADPGEPLAIRAWPQQIVSIETQWDFEVVVNFGRAQNLPADLRDADLIIQADLDSPQKFSLKMQHAPPTTAGQDPVVALDTSPVDSSSTNLALSHIDHYLDRPAGDAEVTLRKRADSPSASSNAVSIAHVADRLLVITVDGVRVAFPTTDQFFNAADASPVDVLLLMGWSHRSADDQSAAVAQALKLNPRYIVVLAPPHSDPPIAPVLANGNTLAVRQRSETVREDTPPAIPQWVQLKTTPWKMSPELAELFAKKEQACRDSQEVFAKLSTAQMNFKPANGTHTPRWNAEHMMGRELLFFSQIYAAKDSGVSIADLNPQQMPPDYVARHADWDGREEARQMARVTAFTRRFAYLLDGLELDAQAPGSSWRLRGLLAQMEAHYREHTANVVKKFELAEWPKE